MLLIHFPLFSVHVPYVNDGLQHDSHEFMLHFLDALSQESLKIIPDEGLVVEPLYDLFSFKIQEKGMI